MLPRTFCPLSAPNPYNPTAEGADSPCAEESMSSRCSWLALIALSLCVAAPVALRADQIDRRSRKEPDIFLDTGGRTGTLDQLVFTADGKSLLATGEDKVVRVWPLTDK